MDVPQLVFPPRLASAFDHLLKSSDGLHSLILPVQNCQTSARHAIHPRIPLVKRKLHSNRFFPVIATFGNYFQHGCFPEHTTDLTFSCQELITIYTSYPHNLHFHLHRFVVPFQKVPDFSSHALFFQELD